jgi:SagB-type dehydrogenase family enzyme
MRLSALLLLFLSAAALAAPPEAVVLPKPERTGGKTLMQALSNRRSGRQFRPGKLPAQQLSNLLWAAYGVNRADGRRTAPSAMNRQSVDVYVTLPDAAYLYNAREHKLEPVAAGDLRAATGTQSFAAEGALNLVLVADMGRFGSQSEENKATWAGVEAGAVVQNVYLYCASEGLATVVRASFQREALAQALKLKPGQKILVAQTVGFPKD